MPYIRDRAIVLKKEAFREQDRRYFLYGLEHGYLDATTLMECLIARQIPQRRAHHLVGVLVGKAIEQRVPLSELALADFQAADRELDESVYDVLGARKAIDAFRSYGSTAPAEVDRQIARWKNVIAGDK